MKRLFMAVIMAAVTVSFSGCGEEAPKKSEPAKPAASGGDAKKADAGAEKK